MVSELHVIDEAIRKVEGSTISALESDERRKEMSVIEDGEIASTGTPGPVTPSNHNSPALSEDGSTDDDLWRHRYVKLHTKSGRPHDVVRRPRSFTVNFQGVSFSHSTSNCRLWFVRIPKPAQVPEMKGAELEVETYRAHYKLLNESLNVKKLERDAAREATRSARDSFKHCRDVFDAKAAEIEPLRVAIRTGGAAARKLRDELEELDARTEEELDRKIVDAKYKLEHESIALAEEKKLVVLLKKLETQRPKIKALREAMNMAAQDAPDLARSKAELSTYEAELKILKEEKDMQFAILQKYREQEEVLERDVDDLFSERRRSKEVGDAAYARLADIRKDVKRQHDAFYNNRRLSRRIREHLAKGEISEAKRLCAEQMDAAHAKLAEDATFRREYYTLWEEDRSLSQPFEEVESSDLTPCNKESSIPAPKRAEAVLAAALAEAKEEFERLRSMAAVGAAAVSPQPTIADEKMALRFAETQEASVASTSGLKKKRSNSGVAPHKRVLTPSPQLLKQPSFEIPELVKLSLSSAPSHENLKLAELERNRQAQLDAERRKAKRLQSKDRKRQQTVKSAKKAGSEVEESVTETMQEPEKEEELPYVVVDKVCEVEDITTQKAKVVPPPAKLPLMKVMAPKPAARRPDFSRKMSLRKLTKWIKLNGTAFLFLMAILLSFWLVGSFLKT